MSRKSKQVRRTKKVGARKARQEHGDTMRTRYYRRLAKFDCRCAAGGCRLRKGEPIVYRKAGPVVLCPRHAGEQGVEVFDSVNWELAPPGDRRYAWRVVDDEENT